MKFGRQFGFFSANQVLKSGYFTDKLTNFGHLNPSRSFFLEDNWGHVGRKVLLLRLNLRMYFRHRILPLVWTEVESLTLSWTNLLGENQLDVLKSSEFLYWPHHNMNTTQTDVFIS